MRVSVSTRSSMLCNRSAEIVTGAAGSAEKLVVRDGAFGTPGVSSVHGLAFVDRARVSARTDECERRCTLREHVFVNTLLSRQYRNLVGDDSVLVISSECSTCSQAIEAVAVSRNM